MTDLFKTPLYLWLSWLIKSRILLFKYKKKHLRMGYMSTLNNTQIGNFNTFYANVMISNSQIDDFVYVGSGTKIRNAKIGKFCSIGTDVKIGLGMHPTDFLSTFPAFFSIRKQCQITFVEKNYFIELSSIKIGNDVWIGENAMIMDNITIGDGAIIAAGAVVTKDVDSFSIVGGVPARKIKSRFSEDKVLDIIKLGWWNKDMDWIKSNIDIFTKKF